MTGMQGHVLVVDDLESNRSALVRILQKEPDGETLEMLLR